MNYKIVTGSHPEITAKHVEEAIAEGWELYGDPFEWYEVCCQAMVYKDAEPDPAFDEWSRKLYNSMNA